MYQYEPFGHDYITNFFDFNEESGWRQTTAASYVFQSSLKKLLVMDFDIHPAAATSIAGSLLHRMSDARLHYHTPVHVLSLFQQLQELQRIGVAEIRPHADNPLFHLALWFHDSVYVPGEKKGLNEACSARLMASLLRPFISTSDLNYVSDLINATADHDGFVDEQYQFLLDLDICNFAWPEESYNAASEMVMREFTQPYKTTLLEDRLLCEKHKGKLACYTREQFNAGRKHFLQQMLDKPFIYRTKPIRDLWEKRARENLTKSIQEL